MRYRHRLAPTPRRPKPDSAATIASLVAEDRTLAQVTSATTTRLPPFRLPKASAIPAAAAKGWKIQLAATPTEAAAQALLDSARDKAPKLLAKASPYTEPVVKNSVTLYRARFAGFATKQAARDACDALAKQKFTCLALSN